jgi:hypothetical protein
MYLPKKLRVILAVFIPLVFLADIICMIVYRLQGNDATALVGGTAIGILLIIHFIVYKDILVSKEPELSKERGAFVFFRSRMMRKKAVIVVVNPMIKTSGILPAAIRAGLSPIAAAMAMNLFGHGFALSGDYVIQAAPKLTADAAGIPVSDVMQASIPLVLIMGLTTTITAIRGRTGSSPLPRRSEKGPPGSLREAAQRRSAPPLVTARKKERWQTSNSR